MSSKNLRYIYTSCYFHEKPKKNEYKYSGTNLTFGELLDTVQRGSLLRKINIGPIRLKGDFLSRYSQFNIIVFLLILVYILINDVHAYMIKRP